MRTPTLGHAVTMIDDHFEVAVHAWNGRIYINIHQLDSQTQEEYLKALKKVEFAVNDLRKPRGVYTFQKMKVWKWLKGKYKGKK
ncbi:MAG: hypothetical protein ACXABY_04330 [Candidatus Thorarchaeota archaeon]|jgi:hypothetical protein